MRRKIPKMTKSEAAYVRDMERTSAFEKVDRGEGKILTPEEYPEPIKKLLRRERGVVHVKLTLAAKRRLENLSRRNGIGMEELARRWVEQGLKREAV